jgi:hypothetical protein
MMSDLLNRKTASRYTPLDKVLDNLISEAMPNDKDNNENTPPERTEK